MFDLSFPALSVPFSAGRVPVTPHVTFDPTLPFALTLADRNPAAAMSGEARPRIIGHFTTLTLPAMNRFAAASSFRWKRATLRMSSGSTMMSLATSNR